MNVAWGVASWTRVNMPSTPPIAKNTNAVAMKRTPMTEWLTAARRCSPGPVAQIARELAVQSHRRAAIR